MIYPPSLTGPSISALEHKIPLVKVLTKIVFLGIVQSPFYTTCNRNGKEEWERLTITYYLFKRYHLGVAL